jgi:hypothetical protein
MSLNQLPRPIKLADALKLDCWPNIPSRVLDDIAKEWGPYVTPRQVYQLELIDGAFERKRKNGERDDA